MTEEEWKHGVSLIEQAQATIEDVAGGVIHGHPSRGSWWDGVEALRQAGERLTSACAALQERS